MCNIVHNGLMYTVWDYQSYDVKTCTHFYGITVRTVTSSKPGWNSEENRQEIHSFMIYHQCEAKKKEAQNKDKGAS